MSSHPPSSEFSTPIPRRRSGDVTADSFSAETPLSESLVLLRRYQDGEQDALAELLGRYQERLRRIARIRLTGALRKSVDTMDIVQCANKQAIQNLQNFKMESPDGLIQWLAAIVTNEVLSQNRRDTALKRDRMREENEGPADDAGSPPQDYCAASREAPEEVAWRNELKGIVDDCMTRLAESEREVILLRDYCGLPWEDIAPEVGRSTVNAAQKTYDRAKAKLKRMVRARMPEL